MQSHVVFLIFWLINALVIYLLGLLTPNTIVLGTYRLTTVESALHSGFWVAFFFWTMRDYLRVRKVEFSPISLKFYTYLFINVFGVWVVSRCSQYTGLGITSYLWAFLIGGVIQLLQSVVWKLNKDNIKE